uniref:HYLS1_C domain-containing protein n=2 Tax=Macrostomum lignano TaxID=282301 RepID=A0A1I8IQB3_9PLAT
MDSPAVFHLSEIRRQLEILGYRDVPESKLREYKAELDAMVSRDDESSVVSTATGSEAATPRGRMVRRKTARRLADGGRAVVEESCRSSVVGDDDFSDFDGRFGDDDRRSAAGLAELPEDGRNGGQQPPTELRPQPPSSAGSVAGRRPRQLIRPTPRSAIDGLAFRRSDPVRRYHQYAALWAAQGPTPGETQHRALRWAVREHLAEAQVPAGAPPPPPPGRARAQEPVDRAAALREEIRRELASYGFK